MIEGDGLAARVLMGTLWGQTSPVTQHGPTIYANIALECGASLPIDAEADERAIMLTEGAAALDGVPLALFSLYILAPGEALTLRAATAARALLLGGEAFPTKRHVWWNFVSSSRDRIHQASEDWTARRFPVVPGDEEEWIPIPAVPKTVSYP